MLGKNVDEPHLLGFINTPDNGSGNTFALKTTANVSDETPMIDLDLQTRPSIFLRLKQSEAAPRELAWRQFYDRYGPVIANYARRKGANQQQADEVVQDVITGFFAASHFGNKDGRSSFALALKSTRASRRRRC